MYAAAGLGGVVGGRYGLKDRKVSVAVGVSVDVAMVVCCSECEYYHWELMR